MAIKAFMLTAAAVSICGQGSAASAQTTAPQEAPAPPASGDQATADGTGGIADIVVTAQRREENLQRVAVAVSAVSAEQLVSAGVSDVSNLSKLVPSLVVQTNGGSSTNFYLRGVGSYATNAFAENAIAFNFAGVYVARPTSPLGTFFDLERIEVVKGPQGTLYGRNATGGAINVLPNRPEIGRLGATGLVEIGNYDALKSAVSVNLPIGEIVAIRAAGQASRRNGYMSDGYDDERGEAARLSFLLKPNDRFSVLVVGDYFHQGGRGAGSVLVPGATAPTAPPVEDRIGGSDPRSVAELRTRFAALVTRGSPTFPARTRSSTANSMG